MSLAGRAATRGDRATVYRPTITDAGGGSRKVTGWTVVATGYQVLAESLTAEVTQRIFGQWPEASLRIYDPHRTPLLLDGDRILFTQGRFTGERYRLLGSLRFEGHRELALERTTEVFP